MLIEMTSARPRARQGPCRSAMKAQPRSPLSRATRLNSRSPRPPPVVDQRPSPDAAAAAVRYAWAALRNTLDGSCRRRASLLCLPPPQTIDGPLSGPRRPNSSETGRARSTPGPCGLQTKPAPQPTGTQPLHMPPIAPVVGLDRFRIDVQSS